MSDRLRITANVNNPLIDAEDMSVNITGPATNINGLPGISYDIQWTGTPTGTLQVQVSNTYTQDPQGNVVNAGNWTTLPSGSFTGTYPVPSGSADTGFLDVVGTEAAWVRLTYTATSGTGALTVVPAAKVW